MPLCRILSTLRPRLMGHGLWRVATGLLGLAGASCSAFHPSGDRVLAARAASRGDYAPAAAPKLDGMGRHLVLVGATRGDARAGTTASIGGTAFPVTTDGYFLTAAHCVTNRRVPFQFVFREGPKGSIVFDFARLVWISPKDDLALLHLQSVRSNHAFRLADPQTCHPGATVYALGLAEKYLRPGTWASSCGGKLVRRPARPWWPVGAKAFTITHTAPVWRGDSGGPLVDEDLRVLGVHSTASWGRGGSARGLDPAALVAIIAEDREANRHQPPFLRLDAPPRPRGPGQALRTRDGQGLPPARHRGQPL